MTAQKEAMRLLANFARQYNVHVHLVAHPRKGQDEKLSPGKLDVGSSGKITDFVWCRFSWEWCLHREASCSACIISRIV
ncbi:hypothetical protein [Burkholderia sp. Bp8984]|uniref:hypothetical protein n=1 Tax=Burkholderia sp. Bp8984 TaxID=2184549 RepID=UPI0016258197|nr:hypothetical protein [Burkholderia sp. Bp8984]